MYCPVCDGVKMREVEKNNVLIDVCPSCKGVWLDRGELDKLMHDVHETHEEYDRLQAMASAPSRKSTMPIHNHMPYSQNASPYVKSYYDMHRASKYYGYDKYGRPYRKKKKSVFNILEDLFD